jgi:hypothetical protein
MARSDHLRQPISDAELREQRFYARMKRLAGSVPAAGLALA